MPYYKAKILSETCLNLTYPILGLNFQQFWRLCTDEIQTFQMISQIQATAIGKKKKGLQKLTE